MHSWKVASKHARPTPAQVRLGLARVLRGAGHGATRNASRLLARPGSVPPAKAITQTLEIGDQVTQVGVQPGQWKQLQGPVWHDLVSRVVLLLPRTDEARAPVTQMRGRISPGDCKEAPSATTARCLRFRLPPMRARTASFPPTRSCPASSSRTRASMRHRCSPGRASLPNACPPPLSIHVTHMPHTNAHYPGPARPHRPGREPGRRGGSHKVPARTRRPRARRRPAATRRARQRPDATSRGRCARRRASAGAGGARRQVGRAAALQPAAAAARGLAAAALGGRRAVAAAAGAV